jgi:type II secretion system protein D
MNRFKITLIAFAWVLLCGASAFSQEAKTQGAPETNAAASPAVNVPATNNATTAANSAAPERNIRFQFDGIPYPDVLERFAQMAGKPLLSGTNLQGTLTYNDPKPYTYPEALDTLNLILSMKGMTLMEDGHYLRLVPFKELSQMPLRILRGLDNTGDVRPGEIVTVVLEVKNLDTKEVGDAVLSMLSNAGSIAPLTRGRGLIVTDRLSSIQRIRSLLAVIDNESVAQRQMKAFTLLHASGAVVADLINRTFGSATAQKRTQYNSQSKQMDVLPADPSDYVTAVYDDASRTLVLFGPRDRLVLAEELVSKFEDKEGGAGEVRIYYPQITKAEDLAQMIRQAVPGVAASRESATAAATKARVIADNELNRLIVAAPLAGQLDQIEQLINQLDKPVHGTGGTGSSASPTRTQVVQITKVFRPRASDVTSVAKILSEALSKRLPNGAKAPTANVTVEPSTQSVVVTGSPGDVQIALDIVTQLETGSSMPLPQQTRFIDAGTVADAKRLLPLVEQIYRSQVTDSLGGQVAHAKIIVDSDSGRLIVTASGDHLKRIEEIVAQLKAERIQPQPRRLQILALKNLRIDTALSSVSNLVSERMTDRRFEGLQKPLLLPDTANNRLLVTATDEQFKEIQDVLNTLDVAPDSAKREMAVFSLQSKSASEIIALATQLMSQLGEDQANPQLAPKLIPDSTGKGIIVLAMANDLARITNLVQRLDSASATATTRQSKAIELFSRSPAELTPLVQQLYIEQSKGQSEPSGGPATLLADARNNRIMVSGSEKEIARVESIVRQLDPEGRKGTKEETRVIRLKSGLASDLASLVEKSLNAQSRQIKILVDARSNSLVVTGEAASVEAAAQVIEQLDTRSDLQPRELRIVELKQGDANSVAPMVTSLSAEMLRDQRGPEYTPQTKIVPDAAGNRLILTGPKDELNTVAGVIERLNQAPEAAGGARVFKLTLADALTVLPVVSNAMLRFDVRNQPIRRVSVSADKESNSIIVSGPRADLQDAQTIIERLDSEGVEKGRSLKVIEVRTDDADGLAALALKVFTAQNSGRNATNLVSITPEPSGKRLIVLAPPSLLPQVESVVSTLDANSGPSARALDTIELKNANASELLTTVNRIYSEQTKGKTTKPATIYPDASGSRLMVYGAKEQAEAVRQIVETLESQPRAPRETKVFELGRLAEAQRILPLAQQLYRDQTGNDPSRGPADAQMVSDGRTGRIIVSARTNQLPQIEEIIARLQVAAITNSPARETRAFDVGRPSDVQRLLPLVQQLYQDQWKDKAETDPADAQIMGDARTGRLIVTGKPDHVKQIEAILNQLNKGQPKADTRDTRIYNLATANATELASTVRMLYQDQARSRLGTLPSDTLILPDASANRLVVAADTIEIEFVEAIIKKLDQVDAQAGRTRVFKLQTADADQVATVLSTALAQFSPGGRNIPRLTSGVDKQNNVLIVSGELKDLQAASVIVEQMDAMPVRGPRQMRVIPLRGGGATAFATRVRDLYLDQMKGQPRSVASDALVMGDEQSNRLILAASESQIKVLEDIVTQLQQTGTGSSRQLRVFMLQRNSAASLATMISQLYGRGSTNREPNERVIVTPSPDDRTLVLDAAVTMLDRVEQLIKTLDREEALGAVEVRTYHVPEASATDLATSLGRLFTERRGQPALGPAPRFEADASANVLMVAATKEQFIHIDKLVEELKKTVQVTGEIRTFKLKNSDVEQIVEVLQAMLADNEPSQPGQPRPRRPQFRPGTGLPALLDLKSVRVAPALSLNAVVVQGPPEKLALAERLIQTLDKEDGDGQSVIQTVHLKKARAESLADAVAKTIATRGPQSRLQRVTVTPVLGPNSLLLNGPAEAIQDVMKVIRELDQESEDDEIKVHIYKLENGNAKEISTVIQQLLQNVTREQTRNRSTPAARNAQASVAVDARSNSLVISGTPAHFRLVEQLLQTLDKAPERAERDVQFVWLHNAKAVDVASKLEAVFAGRPKDEQPVIESDSFSNSITLIGKRADIAQSQELIARLDESSKDTSQQVRLRPLERVPADQMARMLQNIYPQMSAGLMRVVEKLPLSTKPEKSPSTPGVPEAKQPPIPPTPTPGAVRPGETAGKKDEPESSVPEVVIAIDKIANALILSGPTHELDQIDRIISELSFSYVSSDAEFRVFPLKEADPVIVARTLTELFKPEPIPAQPGQQQPQPRPGEVRMVTPPPKITVVAEPRTRSVIVRAKPTDFTLMEALLKQIDVVGLTSQLEFRLVPLTNAPPEKVIPLIQQMVTQLSVVRPGEPLTVTADPRTRGLLVVARDTVLNQVERMINSLDTPSRFVETEVLMVSLKKANAAQLAIILQNMLRPGLQGQMTPEARELQEQVRRFKVKNEAGSEVLLDLSQPIKIMADPAAGGQGSNRLILSSTPNNLKALAAVVEMMDTVPIIEGVHIKLVRLEFTDATTVSQTLSTIFQQGQRLATGPSGPAEPESTAGKALVHPLNVAVDARSNTLILSGQKESLDLAQKIISDLDRKVEGFITEVRLFRLKHASALRLAPLLQSVFAEGASVPGTEGLATQVTRLRAVLPDERPRTTELPKTRSALVIQADETSNIVIVAARSDTVPLIEAIINQLDIPSASGLDSIRVYPLQHADASAIQKIINDLYTSSRAAQLRPDDKPNVTLDPRTQALIVSGNTKAFAFIDGLLVQLDKALPLELRDIRILSLEHADSTEVAATLQRLLDARVTQKSSMSRQEADSMRVLIMGEPRSNSLLITGSKDSFELVETLARELDKAPTALSGRIRLVPLTHADARYVTTALVNLFNQRYQTARTPEVQRQRPIIIPDPRSNSLLVSAGVDDNQVIDDLLQKLDRKLEDPNMSLTVLPVRHNDAGRLAATFDNIFAARLRTRTIAGQPASPQDQVQIEADSLNNALIVSASKDNLETLKNLLEKIDVEPTTAGGLVQTFTLEHADAQRVANMLRALVQQGLYRPGLAITGGGRGGGGGQNRREAMAITVDARSNTLIVSASPENLLIIKEVIKQVDTKDADQAHNMRLYSLKHAKASSLATVIDQFFRARRTGGDGGAVNAAERPVPVTVVADDRVNALLITGSKESFDVIDRIIQQLDGEDTQARMNFKVFVLKQTTASKLQSTLQRLFTNRPARVRGEPPEPITVVADSWANALIVGASVDDMGMVSSLIERLDSEPPQGGLTVQVLPLAKADARRVATTVQGLYREGSPGTASAVIVTADERMNALVVSAGESDLKRITELVKKLDTDQLAKVSEIRVFPLRFAKADSLSTILNTALNTRPPASSADPSPNASSLLQFITRAADGKDLVTSALKEGVLITPDTRMNSLIVSAPVDHMSLLEQIITRLDSSSPQQAQIKVFHLINAHARQMADLLMSLFRLQPQGGASAAANQRAIQYTLIKRNTEADRASEAPESGEDKTMASATLGTDEQNALQVTVDPRTNSLLVGGTEHYVALVTAIIQTLDSSEAQERKSEVFRLKNAQATELQLAVRTFLDQERTRVTQVLGQDAVSTAQLMLERDVAIVADPASNALLLSANPSYFPQIRQLIEQLDQPQPQVLIQVLLAEVTLDSTRDLGVEWNVTRTVENAKLATGTDLGVLSELQSFGGFSAAVTGSDYNFLLRALENSGRLEVLSRPQILTADNKPATISIGQRVPLITDSRVTQFGDSINTFAYQNVGVNLAVTPRIGSDGNVKMEISTTNSSISSSSVDVSPGSKGTVRMPIINERRATTSVSVQSGQSIIIGGLISTTEDDRVKKVPYLGDIPYLGALFRNKTRVTDRKELLILLTPQVLVNVTGLAQTSDPTSITNEQLERSSINNKIKGDQFRKQLLEPLFPEMKKESSDPKHLPEVPPGAPLKKPIAPAI